MSHDTDNDGQFGHAMGAIPMMMQGVTWVAVPQDQRHAQRLADGPGVAHVTHEGVFEMLGHKMKCFRLSTGQAVFEKEDFERFCEVVLGIDASLFAAHGGK